MTVTRLRLDPWPAEYESSYQIDEFGLESDGKASAACDPSLSISWTVSCALRLALFLDGESGRIIRSLFGSARVGTVRVERRAATFQEVRIQRFIVVGSGVPLDDKATTAFVIRARRRTFSQSGRAVSLTVAPRSLRFSVRCLRY